SPYGSFHSPTEVDDIRRNIRNIGRATNVVHSNTPRDFGAIVNSRGDIIMSPDFLSTQLPPAPRPSNLSTPSTNSPLFPDKSYSPNARSPSVKYNLPPAPRPSNLSTPSTNSPLFP